MFMVKVLVPMGSFDSDRLAHVHGEGLGADGELVGVHVSIVQGGG